MASRSSSASWPEYSGSRSSAEERWAPGPATAHRRLRRSPSHRPAAGIQGLPRHQEIERAEILRERNRLIDHALLRLGIAQLHMARQREVLAERIALETIVGEDATQVRIAAERDTVHVEHLAFEPASDGPQAGDARDRRRFVGRHLDLDAAVLGQREQAVIDVEPLGTFGIIDARNLHQLLIFEAWRIAESAAHLDDALAAHRQHKFAHMLYGIEQSVAERLPGSVDNAFIRSHLRNVGCELDGHQRSMVPSRRIFRCSCRIS